MKRIALFVVAATLAAAAMASGLPDKATIAVTTDTGLLVGTGSVHDGTLEVELVDASPAFVTLQLSDADGGVTRMQGVIALDGSLHLVDAGGIQPAAGFAADNALAFELHTHAAVEAQNGAPGQGSEEPAEQPSEVRD